MHGVPTMFDVLVYLFETFYASDQYPDQETLSRKLSQAGFPDGDIDEALVWLHEVADEPAPDSGALAESSGNRVYTRSEMARLAPEARGTLSFLEDAGVIDAPLREAIIQHAMATSHEVVGLSELKVIALMVLWTREGSVDTLILDELLPDGGPRQLH
jgi:Smg protein